MGKDIIIDPQLALFGYSEKTIKYTHEEQKALMLGMVAAKKIILLNWKTPSSPCFKQWLNEMTAIIQMERIRSRTPFKKAMTESCTIHLFMTGVRYGSTVCLFCKLHNTI